MSFRSLFRWRFESAVDGAEQEKAPHGRRENCIPRVPPPREARSTGEMRGLTVVAWCNDYMDNRLKEVKRQEVRAASAFGPLLAISRACHRLEGMAFAFSENRTKVTLRDPTQMENAIVTRRLQFLGRSDRWKGTTGLKKNRARRRDIPRLGLPI
jgi:hypothetical protein